MWNLFIFTAKGYQRVAMIQLQKKIVIKKKKKEMAFNLTSSLSDTT